MLKFFHRFLLASLLFLGTGGWLFADAYLDALESEATGVEVDPATVGRNIEVSPLEAGQVYSEGNELSADMPEGMSEAEFAMYLEENYIGSFTFFERLSDKGKEALYNEYKSQPQISSIREKIKEIYLGR